MLELFLKYKIAKIVPMQESFFHVSILPKNIKLSKEIIALNYEKLSPFSAPFIVTYKEQKELYIWFLKIKKSEEIFVIPESFLLYISLQKDSDGIYIFDTHPKKILILKEKKLLASFCSDKNDEFSINILKNEYAISSVFNLSQEDFQKRLLITKKQLPPKYLYQFLQFSLKKEDLKDLFIQKLSYPLISLLTIYMLVSFAQSYFMQQNIENLTTEYQQLKSQNTKIKQHIHHYNASIKEYDDFAKKELHFQDPFKVVYDLYDVIKPEDKATIKSLDISNNTLRLLINTKEGAIKYLKRLNKIDYFKNVVIQNTYKRRDGLITIAYYIELKDI